MPTVLHIDGLGTEPIGLTYIAPGTSLLDLIRQFGGTFRVEQVPDQPRPPRRLDPRAAEFISDYEYEEPDSVLAVYWRYHSLDAEEFDTVEEAGQYLERSAEREELAGEAIVDGDRIIVCE